jgi:hypothetical protein
MKWSTLQQHKEATILTTAEVRNALSVPQSTKQAIPTKTQNNIGRLTNIT